VEGAPVGGGFRRKYPLQVVSKLMADVLVQVARALLGEHAKSR
jgi:hypothetical protein